MKSASIIQATPSDIETRNQPVRFENGIAMNFPFVCEWTFAFLRKHNLKGCPYGSGNDGDFAMRDLIVRTNRESNVRIQFTNIPIPVGGAK